MFKLTTEAAVEPPYIYPHRGSVTYPTTLNGAMSPTFLSGWRGPIQFQARDGAWLHGVLVEHGTWLLGNYLIQRTGRQEPLARQAHQIRLDLTQPESLLWALYWMWYRRPLEQPFSRLDLFPEIPPQWRSLLLAQIVAWEASWYAEHGVLAFKGVYGPWEPLCMNPQTEADRGAWIRPPCRTKGTSQPALTAARPDLRAQSDEAALQLGYALLDRKEEGQQVYYLTLPPAATPHHGTEAA